MYVNRFFVLFFLGVNSVKSGSAQTITADTGKVQIVHEQAVSELLTKSAQLNEKKKINGYRIKIHFGADKAKAKEIKAKFIARFPGVPAYEKYDQPNFNIRVGDFRTKLDAYRFLKEVQAEFPSAFIVQDEIEFPELNPAVKK